MSLEVSYIVGHCLQGHHTVRMPSKNLHEDQVSFHEVITDSMKLVAVDIRRRVYWICERNTLCFMLLLIVIELQNED